MCDGLEAMIRLKSPERPYPIGQRAHDPSLACVIGIRDAPRRRVGAVTASEKIIGIVQGITLSHGHCTEPVLLVRVRQSRCTLAAHGNQALLTVVGILDIPISVLHTNEMTELVECRGHL